MKKVGADAFLNKEVFSFLKRIFSATSLLSLGSEWEGLTCTCTETMSKKIGNYSRTFAKVRGEVGFEGGVAAPRNTWLPVTPGGECAASWLPRGWPAC